MPSNKHARAVKPAMLQGAALRAAAERFMEDPTCLVCLEDCVRCPVSLAGTSECCKPTMPEGVVVCLQCARALYMLNEPSAERFGYVKHLICNKSYNPQGMNAKSAYVVRTDLMRELDTLRKPPPPCKHCGEVESTWIRSYAHISPGSPWLTREERPESTGQDPCTKTAMSAHEAMVGIDPGLKVLVARAR